MNARAAQAVLRSPIAVAALFTLALLLPAAPASAQGTPQQRAACEDDAMRLCGQFVPDVERIKACMSRRQAQLSPACRVYFGGGKRRARRR
jgi:hypothetical protein